MAMETITSEEFDQRMDASNERLRQELTDAQDKVRQLDDLIRRKEAFAQKLDTILNEIEREEAEIAIAERKLRPRRIVARRSHLPA